MTIKKSTFLVFLGSTLVVLLMAYEAGMVEVDFYSANAASTVGSFESVSGATCSVAGWAQDPDSTHPIFVSFFRDGPWGQGGTFIGGAKTVSDRFDHVFPTKTGLYDSAEHDIYIYGIDLTGDQNSLLAGSPKSIRCPQLPPADE